MRLFQACTLLKTPRDRREGAALSCGLPAPNWQ